MPDHRYLARIHILKKEAGLDDDQYRVLLNSHGVASSTEFSNAQASKFASFLQEHIIRSSGKTKNGWGNQKYESLRNRPGDYASPAQLRMIEAMWRDIARNPADEALEKFIERQTGVRKIIWLKKTHVKPILTAMKKMKVQ